MRNAEADDETLTEAEARALDEAYADVAAGSVIRDEALWQRLDRVRED